MIGRGDTIKIASRLAILDVMHGRKALAARVKAAEAAGKCRIPVTIRGFITHAWGGDDGVSIESAVDVAKATLDGEGG